MLFESLLALKCVDSLSRKRGFYGLCCFWVVVHSAFCASGVGDIEQYPLMTHFLPRNYLWDLEFCVLELQKPAGDDWYDL